MGRREKAAVSLGIMQPFVMFDVGNFLFYPA